LDEQIEIGSTAPDFCLPDQDGAETCLKKFRGSWVVLYFYPRDNTRGCTIEALAFTANLDDFRELGATVIGVSPDSTRSHSNFVEKHSLRITLLSDPERRVLEKYGVWQLKKSYGREYYGVVRTTFIIDPEGVIRHLWRKVRVKGHVEAVKEKLSELGKE
jgi:peroxiredoxin Q/BCP